MRGVVAAERETFFQASVQDGEPYRWTALDASLDISGTLRLSHLVYLPPPSLEELRVFEASRDISPAVTVHSVRAIVRTLTANKKVEEYVVACFPLDVQRLSSAQTFTMPSIQVNQSGAAAAAARPLPKYTVASLLPHRYDAAAGLSSTFLLPCPTDIVTQLNIRLGLDGFTELRVDGPGTVVFTGEQRLTMVGHRRHEYTLR
ncbi:hypothetical protein LPMP_330550 [Leishmania panamensis]|uniref:Uncharacterized protein n=3 Tax=Leishmania guyanensis species complex TaxID=38579 RepID=A0A088RYX2_LEIPA|nr:hypothetical protein LPMP_330550 [Leishmania panamensis]AIO01348.1 hypothetical protein LPMP_330550 [Leishmania panamensis]CCM18511.1 hypothetical protein, conserved [Leishmania guyanensis]